MPLAAAAPAGGADAATGAAAAAAATGDRASCCSLTVLAARAVARELARSGGAVTLAQLQRLPAALAERVFDALFGAGAAPLLPPLTLAARAAVLEALSASFWAPRALRWSAGGRGLDWLLQLQAAASLCHLDLSCPRGAPADAAAAALEWLPPLPPQLRCLLLARQRRLGDAALAAALAPGALRSLDLSGTGATDAIAPALLRLPALRALSLDGCAGVSDALLDALTYGLRLAAAGAAAAPAWPAMRELCDVRLGGTRVSAAAAPFLLALRGVQRLDLGRCEGVTLAAVAPMMRHHRLMEVAGRPRLLAASNAAAIGGMCRCGYPPPASGAGGSDCFSHVGALSGRGREEEEDEGHSHPRQQRCAWGERGCALLAEVAKEARGAAPSLPSSIAA